MLPRTLTLSVERHKLWMIILTSAGFALMVMCVAVQESFLLDAGEDAKAVMLILTKLSANVMLFGLLIVMPSLALRWRRIEGKSLWRNGGLAWWVATGVGIAAIVAVTVSIFS
jgi:uncharacterized membrane protein YhaH (DUF805 family)